MKFCGGPTLQCRVRLMRVRQMSATLSFGKYRSLPICQIPFNYLRWLYFDKICHNKELHQLIKAEYIKRIEQDELKIYNEKKKEKDIIQQKQKEIERKEWEEIRKYNEENPEEISALWAKAKIRKTA